MPRVAAHERFRRLSARAVLTGSASCGPLCHMKAITIRELHASTGKWVRRASALGELQVTQRGLVIAKITPASSPPPEPFFARRKLTKAFRAAQPFLRGGPDSTLGISEDREHNVP